MSSDPTRIVGYNIYQTTNPDIPKKEWEKLNDEPAPDTHFVQDKSKLKPGVTYYSYITAVNALGIESEPSEIASVTVPLDDQHQEQSKQTATVKPGRLPKRITPIPVKEAITEIRFNSSFPADSIFGIIYNEFKATYSNVEKLPILQVPEVIRANDPAFVFQPYYRLRRGNFLVSIGPKVLSLSVTAPYPGWSIYLPEITTVFTRINALGFIENVTRAAIRYVDFFNEDIFKNVNLKILMNDEVAPTDEAYFRTLLQTSDFQSLLQIANNARMEHAGHPPQTGSIIDIDTFRTTELENFFNEVENYLNAAHYAQKELFFSLLKPDFLARFNPEYDTEE